MESAELRELLTPEALALLDSLEPSTSTDDVVRLVGRLRRDGHPAGRVAAVLSQYRLRRRAAAKFGPFAERMLFTEGGLEQATRLRVAALHAGRFAAAGLEHVADLGIGGDAMAMAAIDLRVTAVERDEVTAALAAYNLAPWPTARVVHGDLASIDLDGVDGIWLDPARREGARRLADPGDVVELVLWSGRLARPGIGRAALVLGTDDSAHELTAEHDSDDAAVGALGEWVYEPDGAVIRARLIGLLAGRLGGRMLDPTIAYITADRLTPTPFARAFRVLERWPLDVRVLRRELAARDIGVLEIKKRGVDIDPAVLRPKLQLRGEHSAVLILTRAAGEKVALLAERADEPPRATSSG